MSDVLRLAVPAAWETWRRLTEQDLEGERDAFVGQAELVWLPASTHAELAEKAQEVGWTYGQLLGYLIIQGILHAAGRAGDPVIYNPHYPECPAFDQRGGVTCTCWALERQ